MLRISTRASCSPSGRAPDVLRQFYHQAELRFLHLRADRVAQLGAGEAGLWADGESLEWDEPARFVDALSERCSIFEKIQLGRNEPEHDRLVLRHEAQRGKIAGAR